MVSEAGWRGLSALVACITAPELASTTIEEYGGLIAFDRRQSVGWRRAAGVCIAAEGGDSDEGRQAQGAPAQAALANKLPHATSALPNPVFRCRSPRPPSWPFCSAPGSATIYDRRRTRFTNY